MPGLPVGQERVRLLYEEYVHYSWLKQVWDHPVTDRPGLEPAFAAACHGIELAFLQMAEFINDWRAYVAKRPRIEAMALDIRAQLQLLGELVDGELEEEGQPLSTSLTQDFPFDGCPPTTPIPAHSPGLARLIQAVEAAQGHMSSAERNSLIKVSLQITSAFQAAFQRWTVGLGIEHQLNTLLEMQGITQRVPVRAHNLDYMALVRPQVVEATLTAEAYENAEDFFFRSIHLGTECWMAVANWTVAGALGYARQGQWHVAASRITQAARVLTYLGDHIMTLTRMNLRDYLELKVQLEGTSGAGSSQVRAIRGVVLSLMEPLQEQVLQLVPRVDQAAPSHAGAEGDTPLSPGTVAGVDPHLLRGVMHVYVNCDQHPGLYNYAKALEDVESALLGGFYYKHYCLAANVIGSESRGTMRRAVAGLKAGYERQLFPVLDAVRSQLGKDFDEQLAHMKGRMMDAILTKYSAVDAADAASKQRAMIPSAVASIASAAAMSVLTANARTVTAATGSPAQANTAADATAPLASAAAAGMAAAAAAAVLETAASARSLASAVSEWDDAQSCVSCTGLCPMGFSNSPEPAEDAPENGVGEVHGSGGCPFMSAPPASAAARACLVAHSTAPAAAARLAAGSGCPARHTSCPVKEGGGGDAAAGGDVAADGDTAAAGNRVAAGQKGSSEASTHHSVSSTSPSDAARHWLYSTDGLPADYLRWSHSATAAPAASAAADAPAAADAGATTAAAAAVAATAVDAGAAAAAGKPDADGAQAAAAQAGQGAQVSFLDHAWGEIPPRVWEAGLRGMVAAAAQGNAAWDTLFGEVMPKASQHVLQILGLGAMSEQPGAPHTHWGHNSHELVWRTISCIMSRLPGQQAAQPLRLLTSDMEFYSFTRQMNALWQQQSGGVEVEVVPVEPLATFSQRFLDKAAQQRPDVVYCSQVTYLTQQALIPDISHFAAQLSHILASPAPAASSGTPGIDRGDSNINSSNSSDSSSGKRGPPLVLVDGYHGFCALPTDLSSAFSCPAVVDGRVAFGYVAGLLKHAGCGPNAAFVVLGGAWQPQPLNTGWLADLSVLAPGSAGICAGSTVGYTPHLALQGGTPGYMLPLLCFNALMECWAHPAQGSPIHVAHVHQHVLGLQRAFVAGLAHMEATQTPAPVLSVRQLVSHPVPALEGLNGKQHLADSDHTPVPAREGAEVDGKQRVAGSDAAVEDVTWSGATGALSHTLVFKCDTAQQAAGVVAHMASRGVAVDTRKQYVRLGLGFNHTSDHLAALLRACSQL